MGPESAGGGLRFESSLTNTNGVNTRWGSAARFGNSRGQVFILHTDSRDDRHQYAGVSGAQFGANQVPSGPSPTSAARTPSKPENAQYRGRRCTLSLVGRGFRTGIGGLAAALLRCAPRAVSGNQLVFPCKVTWRRAMPHLTSTFRSSTPRVSKPCLRCEDLRRSRVNNGPPKRLPRGTSARIRAAPCSWMGTAPGSDLSLSLEEWSGFVEVKRRVRYTTFGFQVEAWKSKRRDGALASQPPAGDISHWRDGFDASVFGPWNARAAQDGHTEPLFNAAGDVVGEDVRATAFEKLTSGGMVAWQRPFRWDKRGMSGTATLSRSRPE